MTTALDGSLPASVRFMTADDLEEILAIEQSAYDFPWTGGIFRDCLRVGYPAWVYARDGKILGYGVMSAGAGEGHILNLCVRPELQGQGLGSELLKALLLVARILDITVLFLEVRPSNAAALKLYRKFGFDRVGNRKNYYPAKQGREDAVVLVKKLREESP